LIDRQSKRGGKASAAMCPNRVKKWRHVKDGRGSGFWAHKKSKRNEITRGDCMSSI